MAKQLRLDVAQLTDVGRKREHNEDNMAYVIPKDPQVMTKKGALFIVADGMGGHAAGEVASEIAVDTVSSAYYQDESDDVPASLLRAIKRANGSIHQRAAENMLRSGMGTTCVAAVLRGNMAYIANVGDSRAYILRKGQVRQISQDHSWVAEQVRAGLLTDEQARTHAQRNVITRSLGTQPDVEIDVFYEPLEEGDSLVFCTDGLSGLVSDEDLQSIVERFVPQESVYHLVERANENGGPDNITAIVVQVQEVGEESPSDRRPVYIGAREESENAITSGSLATVPLALAPAGKGQRSSGPLRLTSGPLVAADVDTAPQPVVKVASRGRGRLFYPTMALLILFAMSLAGGGAYLFLRSGLNITQSLQQAHTLLNQANGEIATNPTLALQHLAAAQKLLQPLQNAQLSGSQLSEFNQLFQVELTTETRAAIRSYNQRAAITALPCTAIAQATPINDGSTGTHAQHIASVPAANGTSFFYALGQDAKLYEVKTLNGQHSLAGPLTLPGNPQVLDITGTNAWLSILMKANPSAYSVGLLLPGQPHLTSLATLNPAWLVNHETPFFIVGQGADVYIALLASPNGDGTQDVQIIDFSVDAKNVFKANPARISFIASAPVNSVAAFPGQLFFLQLANGQVESIQLTTGSTSRRPLTVQVQSPLAPPLAVSPAAFTPTMPVPTAPALPTQVGPVPLVTTGNSKLAVGDVQGIPHLYVADASNNRVLDLRSGSSTSGTGTNVTLQLAQQYASTTQLASMTSIAVNSRSATAYILAENAPPILSLVSINTNPQAATACA